MPTAQKELISDEHEQIQNQQQQEIAKLKGLLNFREQEAVDQLATLKQHQQQLDQLKAENQRLRVLESAHDDIQVSSKNGRRICARWLIWVNLLGLVGRYFSF